LPENRSLNENKIKNLTGGDLITARFLRQEFFDFKPTHTLWIFGNHKPNIKGTDEGIWRRIFLIPFLVTIPDNERRPQSEILAEFEQEKDGILRWIIDGWKYYLAEGLTPPSIVSEFTKEYRTEQDHVTDFVIEVCETKTTARIKKAELLGAYQKWCTDNHEYPLKRNTFYKRMEMRDGIKSDVGTDNVKYFVGIELKGLFDKQHEAF